MHIEKVGFLLSFLSFSPTLSKNITCQTPVVCDPSIESDNFIMATHQTDDAACEASCKLAHGAAQCSFFTWVPNAQQQVPNCFLMKTCVEMSDPIHGSYSGAYDCDDESIFCGPIGGIPAYDKRKTVWTCDHNIHPYGDETKRIFQDTTCRTTCPSFKDADGKEDIVVSSTCAVDVDGMAKWGPADPAGVIDTDDNAITSASGTPNPACGCRPMVLKGKIQEEDGKVFSCTTEPTYDNGTDTTTIEQENECALLCDGTLVFELFCSGGQWSVEYLQNAAEIFCYRYTGTGGTSSEPLSTYWPPAPTSTAEGGATTTTAAEDTTTTPEPTPEPTPETTTTPTE